MWFSMHTVSPTDCWRVPRRRSSDQNVSIDLGYRIELKVTKDIFGFGAFQPWSDLNRKLSTHILILLRKFRLSVLN